MVPCKNAGTRVTKAVEGLALLNGKHDIKNVIALDEKTFLSSPHPKSE
jgi:hypothetical protein